MLKVLLIIILVAFLVGALVLMLAVNYVVSIFRRFRQRMNGEDDYANAEETFRRRSNQYSFRRTASPHHAGGARQNQSQEYQQSQESQSYQQSSQHSSFSPEPEIIVDTRDPNTVNRQIISDDEGEYVDFIEEK